MSITVKFTSGEEKVHDGVTAALRDPFFVLYRRVGGKRESGDTFPADHVVWARLPNGEMVLGRGRVKSLSHVV